ncbi:MAG: two pore domain potassium channel family protein [Gammaproteobacteria bacterium]|nr:two pore domain potassium channel family protein [Gammaproteobacteria bacterium]
MAVPLAPGPKPVIATLALNTFIVATVVLVHYQCLTLLSKLIPRISVWHQFRIVLGVFGALLAHSIEIWIFAIAYYYMHHASGFGELQGLLSGSLLDCVYYSFTTFTTLGFGDIVPQGNIRYLTGIESLTGLVLITWSASFLFFEMQRYWNAR